MTKPFFFCVIGMPITQKSSARSALRRSGIVSLKRPAAGGESCKQDSISIIGGKELWKDLQKR